MGHADKLVIGDWNAICDVCGFKYKASELRDRWDGLKVCDKDWEPRNAQEFIRVPKDDQSVAWTRPEPADTFVSVTYSVDTLTSVPDGTFDYNNSN